MARATKGSRRSAAEWQAVMDRQAASGLSRVAFCRREKAPAATQIPPPVATPNSST